MEMDLRRRFFAEEIEAVCKLRSSRLVDALATVPREAFLRPGPWTIVVETDLMGGGMKTRLTPDADPARVNHNIVVAIDPARQLFNGQPGTLAVWIDALELGPGARVLHVGCGLGYYTALMAHCVGSSGRVIAVEADAALAEEAARNLASMPWVEVRSGETADLAGESFDAIVVNAGVTHPLEAWLDALAPDGRMILPLTSTMIPMGNVGKGLTFYIHKHVDGRMTARVLGFIAIFTAVGIRDESLNQSLGKAMMAGPAQWGAVKRLRRDPHEASPSCWLHGATFCLSTDDGSAG